MTRPLSLLLALLAAPLVAQVPPAQPADLVVTAGHVYTADAAHPLAQAFAVRGDRVVFVGSAREALTLRGPQTRVVDLPGLTVLPGITDAHTHLLGLGTSLRQVNLTGSRSFEEVVRRVAARAAQASPGEWIEGRGWNQMDWPDTRFPTHEALSRAVPNNPVVLERVDGHAILVNARALELARVTAQTADPTGGRILRNADRSATGVFVDDAQDLIGRVVPNPSREQTRDAVLAAIAEVNRWGLVGVHDAGVGAATIDIYEELARAGRYNLRNYVMIAGDSNSLRRYFARGPQQALYDGRLWLRSIKLVADGALGSRGAALLEDYSDEPGNRGLITTPLDYIRTVAVQALRHGFQVDVHAIGDRANREALNAFESALQEVPTADHRFRIEHAQIIHRQDIPRFAQLGVIPSMQASHQSSDAPMAMNRIGWTRSQGAYAWRSLLNTGVVIPNGTDFPVEAVNPLIGFHAAITRQDASNWPAGGWFPAERMTRDEALLSLTLWPAYASFTEDVQGSLSPGKYADFVVLSQDIMSVAPDRILDTRVLMTVLGGQVVYQKEGWQP
jgi:predicted amidohydrolase YtcJ